jgi:hypothetical protein
MRRRGRHGSIVPAFLLEPGRARANTAYAGSMTFFPHILAVLLLAASLGAALAQDPVPVDDETIFQEVDGAIRGSDTLAHAEIEVLAKDGMVTLSGFARTMEDIALAGSLASRVRGVTTVHNDIRVANQPSRA